MAVFRIGRVFSDLDVDITESSWSGNTWSVAGDVVIPGTGVVRIAQGVAIREQIIAIANNPDQPHVVVQWSQEPVVDGFYRVTATSVDVTGIHLTDGTLSWTAELERLPNFQYAPLESVCSWQLLTNNRSVTFGSMAGVAVPQHAVPSAATDYGPVSGTVSGNSSTSTISTDDLSAMRVATTALLPASGTYGWSIAPAEYYTGGCRVTLDYGTALDQFVIGRRAVQNVNWMVSNGVVRFFVDIADSSHLRVEHWDGAAWRRVSNTNWIFLSGANTAQWTAMTVLRNSADEVAVRVSGALVNLNRIYMDLSIKRGSRWVYGYLSVPPTSAAWPTSFALGVQSTASVASTAITGGFRATTNDATGDRFVLVTGTPACTDTLGTGRTVTSAASTFLSFGIGAEMDGSAATGMHTAQAQAYEFFARRSETTRAVAR